MRRAAAFLALLLCLYWTRAQGESAGLTENDFTQTEDQSEILGVKATSDQTNITPDIWTELKELREMVIVDSVELKKIEKLEQENTVLEARLYAGEKVVEEVRRENTAIQARLTASEIKNAVLEARLNTAENEVEELKRENTVLESRMSTSENEVEELHGEIAEQKVAFTVGLTDTGNVGPFDFMVKLKFSKVFTNIGEAYYPSTGFFIAPVRGTYYFRFTGWETRDKHRMNIELYHNDKNVIRSTDQVVGNGYATVSNGVVLQLERGDVIYLALDKGNTIYDDARNRTTFSGFLLFTM